MQQTLYRFVLGNESYPDFSISTSPALEQAVRERQSAPTVCLNVFNEDGVTIGVNEDPHQVLDLDYCREQGIVVRRRVNSGGAIYAGKGSAFLVLYLPTDLPGVPQTAAEAFPRLLGNAAEALQQVFGLRGNYRPLNDVEIEGRKLMPTSVKIEGGVLTMRILINITAINTENAARALPMPEEKVKDKIHKDLGSRFTCLERELGRAVNEAELRRWSEQVIVNAFGADQQLVTGPLTAHERVLARRFAADLGSDQWLYGKSERMRFDPLRQAGDRIARGIKKAPGGLIWLALLIRQGRIVEAVVNGDWHPRPLQSIDWLEAGLRGLAAEQHAGEAYLSEFLAREDVEFAGVEFEHLSEAFARALADPG